MAKSSNLNPEVVRLKPDMVLVPSPQSKYWARSNELQLSSDSIAMAKADGEFNKVDYSRGIATSCNKYGRVEDSDNIPALGELANLLRKHVPTMKAAKFLVEMYVRDQKTSIPLRVSDFIHYLKGKDHRGQECKYKPCYNKTVKEVHSWICLGLFDLIEVDGKKINMDWAWKLDEMESMINGGSVRVHVLPSMQVKTKGDVVKAWQDFRIRRGYEGLVIHTDNITSKMKPELEIDAVIVAAQKNDGYRKKQVTSVRVALMTAKDTYLEIGDVSSGITHQLRTELWKFKMNFPLEENQHFVYVHPLIVVKLRVNGLYCKQMPKWKVVNSRRVDLGVADSITMRHPCLEEIRQDKDPSPKEVGLNQIPKVVTGGYPSDQKGDVDSEL